MNPLVDPSAGALSLRVKRLETAVHDTPNYAEAELALGKELYAARELFAGAVQGDIAYTSDEALQFLHQRLQSWWSRLQGPIEAPVEQPVLA